jgi:hypothetical protein
VIKANSARWQAAGFAILVVTIQPAASDAGAPPSPPLSEDCFSELTTGTGTEIACLFPLSLSEQERADLKAASRGYVENVTCTLTVRIARAQVDQAIAKADHIFQSPDQPVTCSVSTPKSTFDITGSFAPRVVFKSDKATEATPGLGNVTGVSRVISWPIVQFVNRWPSIRSGMLQIVNAYRDHARKTKEAAKQ